MTKSTKPLIAVPEGSILPTDLPVTVIPAEHTFIEKLVLCDEADIAVAVLELEELVALVEKPHLFGLDVIGLIGVPGGKYDAVWGMYMTPLRRVTLDTLRGEVEKILAAEHKGKDKIPDREPPLRTLPKEVPDDGDDDGPDREFFE